MTTPQSVTVNPPGSDSHPPSDKSTSGPPTPPDTSDAPRDNSPKLLDPSIADPVTNPGTHYSRLEPFSAPHRAQAADTVIPATANIDEDTFAESPRNRARTTAGAAPDLLVQITTPPSSDLRDLTGTKTKGALQASAPALPPKDALTTIIAPEFKDDTGRVLDDPRYRDNREEQHIPPSEAPARMPDHLDGLPHTDQVAITQVSEKSARDPGIKDVGWNERPEEVPQPVVGGVTNDTLWMLVRRFDKQMYHVKAVPESKIVGPLDLQVAEEEEFSPDKLRANLERLYVSVIISIMAFIKHIMRLRSWSEPRRTGLWLAAYIAAWGTNLVLPSFFTLLLVLILFPPSRAALFPPAPLALISSKTGNLQTPRAGTLGTADTLTGAPENHAGEAAEQEATNFVNGFASLAVGTALGKHPDGDADVHTEPGEQAIDKSLPDPSDLGTTALEAKQTAGGSGIDGRQEKDKTKQPMEAAVWAKARPTMRALTALADTWEMFANALSPVPPFNHLARWKLAGAVVPLMVLTALTNNELLNRAVGAGVGIAFFGQPLFDHGLAYLNERHPGWQRMLDLRNSLLQGVPTNAQLTLTLLRIGEANKQPLPPPPVTREPPEEPEEPLVKHEELPSDLQNAEIEETPSDENVDVPQGAGHKTPKKHKLITKLGGLLKGTTKAGVSGILVADRIKANLGSEHAKQRLGIIPPSDAQDLVDGPSVFEARVHGRPGHVIISTTATTPCISWIPAGNKRSKATGEWEAEFSVLLSDIQELRKVGGLGWKGKLVVGWAYEREVYDALELTDTKGKVWTFTAMKRRDELFNRLLAMVKHKWEAW